MRLILWAILLALILGVVAWLTRPGLPEFDAMLREAIQTRIATTDVDAGGDALATVALIGCKLKPSTCFEVVRQSIEVTEEDRTLFTRFQVTGFGRETTCSGAFTNIWCEGDLIR
ncbi:MAG: hypothetical protein H6897_16605 [Rhodobacteraceae bacterium]|jgi:hypothetical protein|uniref:hypothetical protein n=1 Tax=Albidovulum sp. TaxID=1872424 RepID=UPI001D9DB338|nr:hypothetical protein [uncultured Defluviimonas sp.]MCB2126600.1 hypothetical protein [Paracoccaceae bacterium]MCC0071537.1 hypothetical protein [Paracoccaceae bacterium]